MAKKRRQDRDDDNDSQLQQLQPARRMLDEKRLLDLIPLSRTSIYRMEKAGTFPSAVFITPNRRCWFEDEVIEWQQAFDEASRQKRSRGGGRPYNKEIGTRQHKQPAPA